MQLKRCSITICCLLFLVAIHLSHAGDGASAVSDSAKETPVPIQSGCLTPPDTEFRIGLPGWVAGQSGDFGVRGLISDLDIKFTDILKRLDMIAAGAFYARYQRWEFSADGLYMRLSDDVPLRGILFGSGHIALKSAFAEGFAGYRLINCQQGYLSVFAGARFNYMSGDIRLFGTRAAGRHASADNAWVDPVLGTSGRVHLWKPFSLWAKGDLGGFGAASDLTWQVQGGLEVQITPRIYSDIGWRYLKYDYTSGGFTNKTELNGPYLEAGIRF